MRIKEEINYSILPQKDTDQGSSPLLIFSFIPVTGCSIIGYFKENLESRMERKREERKEDDKARSFSTANDFEDYYEKEIKRALQNNDKKALKGLSARPSWITLTTWMKA